MNKAGVLNAEKQIYDRYFVGVIPPRKESEQINLLKQISCEKFNSCAALKSPPHITLHMPFRWKKGKEAQLSSYFENFRFEKKSIPISLRSVDHFGQRVIFLKVEDHSDLTSLQRKLAGEMRKNLNLLNHSYKDRGFHPHLTIAFRDLKKHIFEEAYGYFSSLHITYDFRIRDIALLKHNGDKWEDYQRFPLSD